MKQYMLLPEDSIELLRAQDEAEAAVCVFCERTMILFPCSKIEAGFHPAECYRGPAASGQLSGASCAGHAV